MVLQDMSKHHNNVTFVNLSNLERKFHTRHGMHFNGAGKNLVAKRLCKVIMSYDYSGSEKSTPVTRKNKQNTTERMNISLDCDANAVVNSAEYVVDNVNSNNIEVGIVKCQFVNVNSNVNNINDSVPQSHKPVECDEVTNITSPFLPPDTQLATQDKSKLKDTTNASASVLNSLTETPSSRNCTYRTSRIRKQPKRLENHFLG
jgi:hypothetical protein